MVFHGSSGPGDRFEKYHKMQFLMEYVEKLRKEIGFKDHIFLRYDTWAFKKNKSTYQLGKDTYRPDLRSRKQKEATGVIFHLNGNDILIKESLAFVFNVLDSLMGKKSDPAIIDKVLSERKYRKFTSYNPCFIAHDEAFGYVFQDGRFHVFRFGEYRDDPDTIRVFDCENIYEVVWEKYGGVVVFTSDSTFDFFKGKQIVKDVSFKWRTGQDKDWEYPRTSILDLRREWAVPKPGVYVDLFYFHFNYESKAVFLPSKNIILMAYHDKELKYILSQKEKPEQPQKQEKEKTNSNKALLFILGSILICSLGLNAVFALKRRK